MSAQILFLFGLVFLIHGLPTLGEEEVKPIDTFEQSEPVVTSSPTGMPVIERSSHHHTHLVSTPHRHEDPTHQGFWKKKLIWRPRWVKTWQEKKIYVAVWKRMWGPAIVKEWVPVPKPPPGWVKPKVGNYYIKGH